MAGNLGEAVFDLAANVGPLAKGMQDGQAVVKAATSAMRQDVDRNTGGIGGILGRIGDVAGGVLKAGLVAGTAAVTGLVGSLGACVAAAMGAEQTEAQLNAVLASTKGVAGMTKEAVIGLADSLSKVTTFEDDAIIAGESMLLTFTNIGRDVFPAATTTMLDMSQALGQDLKSSAVQLGKALNDPINGVTALQRVGVTFTEAQKAQIAAMVEAGNVAGAQKLILAELQTEFGGSAVAAGQTFAGQLTILKNSLGNVAESIGGALLPGLTQVAKTLVTTLNNPQTQAAIAALATGIADGLGNAIAWVQANWPTISSVISTVMGVAGRVIGILVNDVVPALVGVFQSVMAWTQANWPTIQSVIETVMGIIGSVILVVVNDVVPALVGVFQSAMAWTQTNWPAIQAIIETVINAISSVIQTVMGAVATFWDQNGQAIMTAAQTVWSMIQNVIGTAIGLIQAVIQTVMAVIRGDWEGAWDGIKSYIATLWDGITTQIGLALELLQTIIPVAWNAIKTATGLIWDGIKAVIAGVWDAIAGIARAALDDLKGALSAAWENVTTEAETAWNGVKSSIAGVWSGITGNIAASVSTVKGDLSSAWESVRSTARTAWDAISGVLSGVWETIKTIVTVALGFILSVLTGDFDSARQIADAAWNRVKDAIAGAWEGIKGAVSGAVEAVKANLTGAWSSIQSAASSGWADIKGAVSATWSTVTAAVETTIDSLKTSLTRGWGEAKSDASSGWTNIKNAITGVGPSIVSGVTGFLNEAKTAVSNKWSEILGVVTGFLNSIRDTIGNFSLADVGANLIHGLIGGITSAAGAVADAVRSAIQNAINAAKAALGISSPSTVFAAIGQQTMQGLADGIESKSPAAIAAVGTTIEALVGMFSGIQIPAAALTAVQTIKDALGGVGDAILSAVQAIDVLLSRQAMAGAGTGAVQQTIAAKFNDLAQLMNVLGNVAAAIGAEQLGRVKSLVDSVQGIGDAMEGLAAAFDIIYGRQSPFNDTTYTLVAGSIQRELQARFNDLAQLMNVLGNVAAAIGTAQLERVKALVESVSGIGDAMESLQAAFETIYGRESPFNDATYALVPGTIQRELQARFGDLQALIQVVAAASGILGETALRQAQALAANVAGLGEAMTSLAEALVEGLTALAELASDSPVTSLPSIVATIIENLTTASTRTTAATREMMVNLAEAIQRGAPLLVQMMERAFVEIRLMGDMILDTGWDLGVQAMRGMSGGLAAGLPSVLAAARQIAEQLEDELKAAWGIASPSKVFENIGIQATLGLQLGLEGLPAMVEIPSRLTVTNADRLGMFRDVRQEHYNLSYTALRPASGWEDAQAAMQRIEWMARMRRGGVGA